MELLWASSSENLVDKDQGTVKRLVVFGHGLVSFAWFRVHASGRLVYRAAI